MQQHLKSLVDYYKQNPPSLGDTRSVLAFFTTASNLCM